MSGVNKVLLIGRLGKDPEIRYTQGGDAVCNFSVATSESWKDKNTGEKKEKTEWHRVVAFRRLGEICGEYLAKGKQVYIEGRLQTRSWEKDGITRYSTEIIADQMQMLGDRGSNQQEPAGTGSNQQQPQQSRSGYTVHQPSDGVHFPPGPDDDDDIPF